MPPYPPGHFHSPLLDLTELGPEEPSLPFDGVEWWEHVDLRTREQETFYAGLLGEFPPLPFPSQPMDGFRYHTVNDWFPESDAYVLSGIIRQARPSRIIEVGSGYSTAVMLDTLEQSHLTADLTIVDPDTTRLFQLLTDEDAWTATILAQPVQEVPLPIFESLESGDLLFIDSSHVAKIGSDVSFLLLRVLPRLQRGVMIHFHDIFYPHSYPAEWIRDGWAWNESLFVRAFLVGNPQFQVLAFNSYAAATFPELFRERNPAFLKNPGGSLWIKKIA